MALLHRARVCGVRRVFAPSTSILGVRTPLTATNQLSRRSLWGTPESPRPGGKFQQGHNMLGQFVMDRPIPWHWRWRKIMRHYLYGEPVWAMMNIVFWVPFLYFMCSGFVHQHRRRPTYYQLVHEAEAAAKYSDMPQVLLHDSPQAQTGGSYRYDRSFIDRADLDGHPETRKKIVE